MTDPRTLSALADQCVKCGMCLQVCPTYRLHRREAESPRGRIALFQALLEEQLPPGPGLVSHLDNCLQCRACEAICPSRVAYGVLITEAQRRIRPLKPRRITMQAFWRLFDRLLARERAGTLIQGLFRLYQRLLLAGGRPARLTTTVIAQATTYEAAPVRLFAGCLNQVLDPALAPAARRVLETMGYGVSPMPASLCCGALHQRDGQDRQAGAQLARSRDILNGTAPVVSLVSACSLHLRERASELPVADFASFVQQHWPETLRLKPYPGTVWVHEACSLRNGLKEHPALTALLRRVPDIELRPLGDNRLCCGAAGTQLLSHRDQATAILAAKLAGLEPGAQGVVVTTNTGCASHLQNGLARQGLEIEVLHPAEFLLRVL